MLFGYHIGSSPEMLALSIFISTFALEDAAIGYAALLAATGMIAPGFAFSVLFSGIYLGDVGLYFLGAAAQRYEPVRARIGERRILEARKWLRNRAVLTLIGARLVPGSRLPVYLASGFLHLPLAMFASATAAATFVWTVAIFSAIYGFGLHATELFGQYKYSAVVVVAAVVLGAPLLSSRFFAKRARTCDV